MDVRKALGWNSRKTNYILKQAESEGFVEKTVGGYRSKLPDYNGYFNASDFLKKVDSFCLEKGQIQSLDYYLYTFSPSHVLAYGAPAAKDLTPIEDEMLEMVFGRMVEAFFDYIYLCDTIKKRIGFEKENQSLPESVKANLFIKDENEKKFPKTSRLDVAAARRIYGDALWEHIFYKMVSNIRFALEKGSLDFTGPEELMAVKDKVVSLALDLARRIYKGEFPRKYLNGNEFIENLEQNFERIPDWKSDFKNKAYAILLTPSPQTMDEYSEPIGKIIQDKFDFWSSDEAWLKVEQKDEEDLWNDKFDIDGQLVPRKKLFRKDLIDWISLMRIRKQEVISKVDEKFMMQDNNLHHVFSTDEISAIIHTVRELVRRVKKFQKMLDDKISFETIQKDPEWFTKDELRAFKIAEDVEMREHWEKDFGTDGPIALEFLGRDKRMKKITDAYLRKVRKHTK